jgi:hypothetical protein
MHEQGFKTSCTGLIRGMPPEPCVLVILGGAGDLARTTLVPLLYALGRQRLLPEPFALIGVARRDWNHDTFRDEIRTYVQEKKGFSDETWGQLAKSLYFMHGDLNAPPDEDYARLRACLKTVQAEAHIPDNVLFHFSVPPQFYGDIAHKLAAASLLKSDSGGWRRLIIEKPFGRDAASARALDRQLLKVVSEEQIVPVQVVQTGLTPQIAPSERLREAETVCSVTPQSRFARLCEGLQDVALRLLQWCSHSHHALDKARALLTLRPTAALAPQHTGTERPLCRMVRRFHPVDRHKGPQRLTPRQDVPPRPGGLRHTTPPPRFPYPRDLSAKRGHGGTKSVRAGADRSQGA